MTYRELLNWLQTELTQEQLDVDVTVEDLAEGECYPGNCDMYPGNGTLDPDHPVITF
jgi:hypothetical protein